MPRLRKAHSASPDPVATPPADEAAANPVPDAVADPPEDLSALRAELERRRNHDRDVREAERLVNKREMEWQQAKAVAVEKRGLFNKAVASLRQVINRSDAPLFKPALQSGPESAAAATESPAPAPGADAWRAASIDELSLPDGIKEKLRAASIDGRALPEPLDTLGAISDFTNRGRRLIDLDGIGQDKADQIADAMTAWFAAHPDRVPPAKTAPPAASSGGGVPGPSSVGAALRGAAEPA